MPTARVPNTSSQLAFALTWVCYASFYFTRKPFSVVKSTLGGADGLSLSTDALGFIDTCFLTFYALAQFMIGPLGDKIGVRPMLATMLGTSALSAALIGVSSSQLAFALLMAINGAAQSAGYATCMTALFPFLPSGSGATTLGWWSTCQQIGGVLSTALAASVLGRYGWRAAFLVPAVGVLCSAVLVGSCLPENHPGEVWRLKKKKEVAQARPATVNLDTENEVVEARQMFVDVARIPFLLHLGVAYFHIKLVRYTLLMWLPFYMSSELGCVARQRTRRPISLALALSRAMQMQCCDTASCTSFHPFSHTRAFKSVDRLRYLLRLPLPARTIVSTQLRCVRCGLHVDALRRRRHCRGDRGWSTLRQPLWRSARHGISSRDRARRAPRRQF